MEDLVFKDAIYWLFMNYDFNYFLFGGLSFLALIIGFFHIVRKWGDF